MERKFHNSIVIILLAFLFAVPGALALFYYQHPNWLSPRKTNVGVFIEPAVSVEELGKSTHWRLLLWAPNHCDQLCFEHLDKLARLRLALGRRLYKLDLVLASTPGEFFISDANLKALKEDAIQSITLSKPPQRLTQAEEIFIVSPEGYLVLAYPADAKPQGIFHDLQKVLL